MREATYAPTPSTNPSKVAVPQHPVTAVQFERADEQCAVIVLDDRALESADQKLLDAISRRRSLLVSILASFDCDFAARIALAADTLAIRPNAKLKVGAEMSPLIAAALVSRIGDGAIRFAQGESRELDAAALRDAQICQNLVPHQADSVEWTRGWLENRHPAALASAASLVRARGGDAIENAEFGRLFAAGLPQIGLRRFLSKDRSPFGAVEIVETI